MVSIRKHKLKTALAFLVVASIVIFLRWNAISTVISPLFGGIPKCAAGDTALGPRVDTAASNCQTTNMTAFRAVGILFLVTTGASIVIGVILLTKRHNRKSLET